MKIPKLVAHRGHASQYPENTLPAIESALKAGACYVEVDIQLTTDGIPVLFHDDDMQRITGITQNITELTAHQLTQYSAAEKTRFGKKFSDTPIPTLAELLSLLRAWPERKAFIEIKDESTKRFGTEWVVKKIMAQISPLGPQCIPISYEVAALQLARALGAKKIGWVAAKWDEASHQIANQLIPDYLFTNHTRLPENQRDIWRGPWQWALYEVTDPALALTLAAKGIDMIETMAIEEMLSHLLLKQNACHNGQ
ncbi:MAG: hypothetical protein COB33_003720 [Thiotrichaceae bacterium]|nr:hypothetical protein [Thiotrichaceae bacterium]PCI11134.1 MAG: glycerophosphodiester phosphodiesterase [Thiotrichales bacterium]PCI12890.1 MAG: glycerophosphodiester phosphodiesterase [Thiotrichales bacterium]